MGHQVWEVSNKDVTVKNFFCFGFVLGVVAVVIVVILIVLSILGVLVVILSLVGLAISWGLIVTVLISNNWSGVSSSVRVCPSGTVTSGLFTGWHFGFF